MNIITIISVSIIVIIIVIINIDMINIRHYFGSWMHEVVQAAPGDGKSKLL